MHRYTHVLIGEHFLASCKTKKLIQPDHRSQSDHPLAHQSARTILVGARSILGAAVVVKWPRARGEIRRCDQFLCDATERAVRTHG
jgi:hypothetical protein